MRLEQRFSANGLEVAAGGLQGYAAVFGSRANIAGEFEEEFRAGAFEEVLGADVLALLDHDRRVILGRTPLTLRLKQDTRGLRYEIPQLAESRRDVLEAVQRGELRGSSLTFGVKNADVTWERGGSLPLRVIHRVSRLVDVGPTPTPAYADTNVQARRLVDEAAMEYGFFDWIDEQRAARLRIAEVEV